MKTALSRESNYDLLRIFCAYLIVLIHCSSKGSICWALSSVAIPLFVMLSGAFIINRKVEPYKIVYIRGIKNLGMPFIGFSLFYIFFDWFIYYFNADKFEHPPSYWQPLFNFFTGGTFYHMWYMYMLAGLYLAAPVIIRIKSEISQKGYILLSIAFLIYGCIIGCTNSIEVWPVNAIQYIGYFMIGGIMKKLKPPSSLELTVLGIFSCIIAMLSWFMFDNLQIQWATNYLSPLTAILATIIFRLTSGIKGVVTKLAASTLFIYLLHPFILAIISRLNKMLALNNHIESQVIFYLLTALVTFVFSSIIILFFTHILIKNKNR